MASPKQKPTPEERFMNPKYWIDMSLAPGGCPLTATGFQRSAPWFWRQLLRTHPALFSVRNADLIRNGRAPEVDRQWILHNPMHALYEGDMLVHHHIEQSYWAAGIPKHFHSLFHRELHPTYGP
jgi:hypothetical protein